MATSRDNNQDADSEKHLQSQSGIISSSADTETALRKAEETTEESEEFIETCSCGHTRDHHLVTPRATYTAWGTFWITIMGVSATPIRVDFICRMCKEKFDFEIDSERLKDFY